MPEWKGWKIDRERKIYKRKIRELQSKNIKLENIMNKRPNNLGIKSVSLQRLLRKFKPTKGDQIILCGMSDNRMIQHDAHIIRKEKYPDLKIKQQEMLIIDPKTLEASICWVITILNI